MTKTQLLELIDHEIQWLYYYAHWDARAQLNENSKIYDMRMMGYTKRVIPLWQRCAPCLIRSDRPITELADVSQLEKTNMNNRDVNMTPLEVGMIIFPEMRKEFIKRLKGDS